MRKFWFLLSTVIILASFLVSGVAGLAPTGYAQETSPAANRTIRVQGEGRVYATPDTATITFGVETSAKTAREAINQNAEKMQKVIATLKAHGIASKDIQTSGFNLYPDWDYQVKEYPKPEKSRILLGYRVNNRVTVRTKDLDTIGSLIDAAVQAGANQVDNIHFGIENFDRLQEQALQEAVKNARHKAALIAEAAGTTIIEVISVRELGSGDYLPAYAAKGMGMEAGEAPTPVEPGQVVFTSRVEVVFRH